MQFDTSHVVAEDGMAIYLRHWHDPDNPKPKAIVQISHGMAEHGQRYEAVAELLVNAGFAVYSSDHRGHGEMAKYGVQGHYGDENGWNLVVSDLFRVNREISKKNKGVPRFLLGHSMGSFIAQQYAMDYPGTILGLALSGSNYDSPVVYRTARGLARVEKIRRGKRARSKSIDYMSFGSFNKHFAPNRTRFDWLSRDSIEVDKYIADPQCGFLCTNQLWMDLLGGLIHISTPENLTKIPNDLPIYVLGGQSDPVGDMGKGLERLINALKDAGIRDIDSDIYPEGRHEMFNETNRETVVGNLADWLNRILEKKAA